MKKQHVLPFTLVYIRTTCRMHILASHLFQIQTLSFLLFSFHTVCLLPPFQPSQTKTPQIHTLRHRALATGSLDSSKIVSVLCSLDETSIPFHKPACQLLMKTDIVETFSDMFQDFIRFSTIFCDFLILHTTPCIHL